MIAVCSVLTRKWQFDYYLTEKIGKLLLQIQIADSSMVGSFNSPKCFHLGEVLQVLAEYQVPVPCQNELQYCGYYNQPPLANKVALRVQEHLFLLSLSVKNKILNQTSSHVQGPSLKRLCVLNLANLKMPQLQHHANLREHNSHLLMPSS